MGYWNYRVVQLESKGEKWYEIYEVGYNDDGKIVNISIECDSPMGESIEELRNDLQHMIQALDKPVLNYEEVCKSFDNKEE